MQTFSKKPMHICKHIWKFTSYFVLFFLVSSCTSQLELGNHQFALGNYNQAALHWNPLAINGNPYAQYNVGLLWENGLGSTPYNLHEAAEWYYRSANQGFPPAMVRLAIVQSNLGNDDSAITWLNMAARWNNPEAISMLSQRNLAIPHPDLYQQQSMEEIIALQYFYGTILGPATYQGKNSTPPTNGSQSYSQTTTVSSGCNSDFECGAGSHCVKPPLQSRGICMQSANAYGIKQYTPPNPNSVLPNMNVTGQCIANTDCPAGFVCDLSLKACVK